MCQQDLKGFYKYYDQYSSNLYEKKFPAFPGLGVPGAFPPRKYML